MFKCADTGTMAFSELSDDLKKQMKKFTIIYVIAAIILLVAFRLTGIASEVGTLYYQYASNMLDFQMPYSDFNAEYPPFAMLLILLPGLVSFSPFTYQIAFAIEVYFFLLAGLYFVYGIAKEYCDKPSKYTDLYIIFSIILLDLGMDRYDVFPIIMMLGSLYFLMKGRLNLSWTLLALGTVTKLFPALLAPLFIAYIWNKYGLRKALGGLVICIIIGVGSMLPFIITNPDTAFMFLTYHMDRGMQVEAVASTFIMFLSMFGLVDMGYEFSYGSFNITGAIPDAVAGMMMPLMVIVLVILYVIYIFKAEKEDPKKSFGNILLMSFMIVMIFMIVNKVLSTQYVIWIIPFVALWIMLSSEHGNRKKWLFILIIALSQLNLIVNYAFRSKYDPFTDLGIIVILVRNILLLIMMYYLAKDISKMIRPINISRDRHIIKK